ncbi:High-affnity carbon uptake protein Hat/HatR [hydrothermal vent metagenome]|uniref:High-affnity carbon uptake protein Hat/HatR n=1 Tax=hydrothermal vent metagenome TaxID=652676 RepID=A0A3B1D4C0_9ZZZZ
MKNKLIIDTPYPGLSSFQEQDQAYFFGRDQETQEVIASLLTARLTFLFGNCGVGKTSLLNAGVAALLRKKTRTPLTRNISFNRVIISFKDWLQQNQRSRKSDGLLPLKQTIKAELISALAQKPNIVALSETEQLKESLRSVLGDVLEEQSPEDLDLNADLSSVLTTATKLLDGNIIILLDQFEKYLDQSGSEAEIQERDKELIEAINHADPRVRFLISIREENLQMLDDFRKKIPQFFTRTYKLNPLSASQTRDAIEKPLQAHRQQRPSAKGPAHIDAELLEHILTDLPTADSSQSSKLKDFQYQEIRHAGVGFDASYLQLLLSQLWASAVKQESLSINLSTYSNLGGMTSLLETHIENAIDRQNESKEIAKKLSICLVTSEGEKRSVSLSVLSKSCQGTPKIISKILRAFIDRERILRPLDDGNFVLFHEGLVPILLEDRKVYEKNLDDTAAKQKLTSSKNQTKKAMKTARRFRRISASLAAILLLSVGVTLFAFNQEKQAEKRIQIAAIKVEEAGKARKQAELKQEKAEKRANRARSQAEEVKQTWEKVQEEHKETEKRLAIAISKTKQTKISQENAETKRKQIEIKRLALATSKAKKAEIARQSAEAKRKQTEIERLALATSKAKKAEIARQNAEAKRKQTEIEKRNARNKQPTGEKKQVSLPTQKRPPISQPRLGLNSEQQLALMLKATQKPVRLDNTLGIHIDRLVQHSSKLSERTTLRGHAMKINDVVFSPDGLQIATASADKTVIIWQPATATRLHFFEGHKGSVNGVAFNPDGSKIATASSDQTVKIWNTQSGEVISTLQGHTAGVNSVKFDPTGKRVITGGKDKIAIIWDLQSEKILQTLAGHTDNITQVAVSANGKWIATASADKTARIWDKTGQKHIILKGHSGSVNGLAFAPDGKRIATVSTDKTARIWDIRTGKPLLLFKGHLSTITRVAFSPDGNQLATSSWDKTTKVWDSHSAEMLSSIRGHASFISAVAFSPDGKQLVTSSLDRTAKIWDQPSQAALFSLNAPSDKVTGITFSPDGKRIATTHPGKTAKIWDADSGKMLLTLAGHTKRVIGVSFSPDARRIATASADKTTKIWDAQTGTALLSLKGHSGPVTDIAFSPNGRLLASVSTDKTVIIWYVNSGEIKTTFSGHQGDVVAVAFSPNGKLIATTSSDKTAKTWEISSGKMLHTFVGHTDTVTGVAFSRDGKQIATTSADKAAKIWDLTSEKGLLATRRLSSFTNGIAFSDTGRRIITADTNKRIQVYAMDLKELVNLAQASAAKHK